MARPYSGPTYYLFPLKMEIITLFAWNTAIDSLMAHFFAEGVAVYRPDLINEAILAASIRADVIIHCVLVEFPTERRQTAGIRQGLQVNTDFGRFRKGNVVSLQKGGQILWEHSPVPGGADPKTLDFTSFQPTLYCLS